MKVGRGLLCSTSKWLGCVGVERKKWLYTQLVGGRWVVAEKQVVAPSNSAWCVGVVRKNLSTTQSSGGRWMVAEKWLGAPSNSAGCVGVVRKNLSTTQSSGGRWVVMEKQAVSPSIISNILTLRSISDRFKIQGRLQIDQLASKGVVSWKN